MSIQTVLLPLFVQILLSFTALMGTVVSHTRALKRGETKFKDIALRQPNRPAPSRSPIAFANQLEAPVLFC